MSKKSRELKRKYLICKILSLLLLFLPVGIFIAIAFISGSTVQKMSLGIGVTLCLIFTLANVAFKWAPRSSLWILLIALTVALQKIAQVIFIVGACAIIEECITSKLEKYYHDKYKINKEIDERFEVDEPEEEEHEESDA